MLRCVRLVAMLLSLAALLSACGPGGAPDAAATPAATPAPDAAPELAPTALADTGAPPVTITFGAQSYLRQAYEPLIEQFNQQNPDIRVQLVSIDEIYQGSEPDPGSQMRKLVSAADTVTLFFLQKEDAAKGYVYDLRPLIDADPTFDRDDFYPNTLDQYAFDGGLYMIPRTQRIQLLAYNKALWARAGLPAPSPDWAMSDLIAAAEQLASKRGDKVEVYGFLDWSAEWNVLFGELDRAGVDLLGTPADALRFDRPELVAALARVAQLVSSGAIYHQPRSPDGVISSDDFQTLINDQRAAIVQRDFLFNGPPGQQPPFEVGVVPYPATPGLPSFGGGEGYAISGGTQHPQEAWRWLAFLSRQQVGMPFQGADPVAELPARKSVAEQSGYWQKLDADTRAAIEAVLARAPTPAPDTSAGFASFGPLGEALEQVLSQGVKPEQALRDAQAKLEDLRAQAQLTPEPTAAANAPIVVATPQAQAQAAEGATTIRFGAVPGPTNVEAIRRLADQFNQNNPEIFVRVQEIGFNSPVELAGLAAQNDCFSSWSTPGKDQITATLDLQPLLDADAEFKRDDIPPLLLAPFQHGGGLYGLPLAVNFRVLSYNQSLFDAAGLGYPSADWTIDDFVSAAQQLTHGDSKQYGYVALGGEINDVLFFLNRFGARLVAGSGEQAQPTLNDPQVVVAVRSYIDMLKHSTPSTELHGYRRSGWTSESTDLVQAGRAGMWFDYGLANSMLPPGSSRVGFEVAVAPLPLGDGQLTRDDFYMRGLFISASSQHPDACWRWLKALSADPASAEGEFPARVSVAESDAFLSKAPAGAAEVYQAYRARLSQPRADLETGSPFESGVDLFWFFRAVDNALRGKALDRELAEAQALTEQFVACTRAGTAGPTCATQVDPKYEGWQNSGQ